MKLPSSKLVPIHSIIESSKIRRAKKIFPRFEESYLAQLLYPRISRFEYWIQKLSVSKTLDEHCFAIHSIDELFPRQWDKQPSVRQLEASLIQIITRTSKFPELQGLLIYCINNRLLTPINLIIAKINFKRAFKANTISELYEVFSIPSIDRDDDGVWFYNPNKNGHYSEVVKTRAREIFALRPLQYYSPYELKQYYVLTMSNSEHGTYVEYGMYQHDRYADELGKACLRMLKSARCTEELVNLLAFCVYDNVREHTVTIARKIITIALKMKMSRVDMIKILDSYEKNHEEERGWDTKKADLLMRRILSSKS